MSRALRVLAALGACALFAQAHIGSPDIYLDAKAGPYPLFITVRPPVVIPGVAEIEVRSESAAVRTIQAVPLPMTGPGTKLAPVPENLKASGSDSQFFTGSLWMMAAGSWQVKITATGDKGTGIISVPVPSAALTTRTMQTGLGVLLSVLMGFLVLGAIAMTGAGAREATLPVGAVPDLHRRRKGITTMAITAMVVGTGLWYGRQWWNSDAAAYRSRIYKPLKMRASISNGLLRLQLSDPGWLPSNVRYGALPRVRSVDDLILDHNHLMHLYVIREPGLDVVYHLHPEQTGPGEFQLSLPSMPAGSYRLYADIVHQNGFPETLTSSIAIGTLRGRDLRGDDAAGVAAPWQRSAETQTQFVLPDRYRMEWIPPSSGLRARQPVLFRFRMLDVSGRPPSDMALYMGMLGHAAFVKTDGTVFAHVHPTGSVSMAAFMKAQEQIAGDGMAGMDMSNAAGLPNEVSFPFGLPSSGRYRVFVQMKHGSTVETGIFDLDAQ